MQKRTIYNTPLLTPALRGLARLILRAMGWRVVGGLPDGVDKCVLTAAPHTTNWDFPLFLMVVFDLNLPLYVMIKDNFFWFPLGAVLRYCGAIPVNRANPLGLVKNVAEEFDRADKFMLVITPEGTRAPRKHWKTGFLRLAHAAQVPVILGFVDAAKKTAGITDIIISPPATASIDAEFIEDSMTQLYEFYDEIEGVIPENYDSPSKER